MENKLISIQKEYVKIYEETFTEKYKNAFNRLDINRLKKFILKEYISSPELNTQLNILLLKINQFWKENGVGIIEEIQKSRSYKILLPIQRFGYNMPDNLKSLGIYFDTILMVDPLHLPDDISVYEHFILKPNDPSIISRRLVLIEHASNIIRTLSFMNFEEDNPLFLIVPEQLDFSIERNQEQSTAFISQIFRTTMPMSHDELVSFINNFKDKEHELKKLIIDQTLLSTLVSNFQSVAQLVWLINTETNEIKVDTPSLDQYGLSSTILSLLYKVEGAIYAQRTTQVTAHILQVDPVIYNNHFFLHEFIVKGLINDYKTYRPYSTEEQAIATGLTSKDVNFLSALSQTELRKIRENGKFDFLRNELRISRGHVQNSSSESLHHAAKEFSNHLIEVVDDFGKTYNSKIKKSNTSSMKTGALCVGSAILGIASLALPQFAMLGLTATGIGVLVGGKSLADVFNERKKNKKEIIELESNPISLLYGASNRKT